MRLIERSQLSGWLPSRVAEAHKQDFGHLWVFGGSVGCSGAPRLAGMGAQAMGAGLVSLVVPDAIYPVVATASLEVMVYPQSANPDYRVSADAVVAGPGWGCEQQAMLLELLQSDIPLVLDADALNMVAQAGALQDAVWQRTAGTVLTPHPGEAARLLGWCGGAEVQRDRSAAWSALVARFGCTVVLKGAGTLVGNGASDPLCCPFGSNRLAVAGSGDVLAGMVGALLAQQVGEVDAAACAVALHALTTEQKGWYRAGELPAVVAALRMAQSQQ